MSLIEVLEAGRRDFLDALQSASPEHASVKPAPDRWSVLECVEHVVTVEHRFLGWIDKGKALDSGTRDAANEARLSAMVVDRSRRAQAPEAVHPKGRFTSLGEALLAFNAARDLSVAMAQRDEGTLHTVGVEHPRFGPMNGAELVHIIAGHARRHAAQIRETVAALGSSDRAATGGSGS